MVYRPETLLEINEMSMENLMKGPYVVITEDKRRSIGCRNAEFNAAGIEKYAELVSQYQCNSLGLNYEGIAEGKVMEFFSPPLARIKGLDQIEHLRLSGNGVFAPDYDYNQFNIFKNIKCIETSNIKIEAEITDFFPKLTTWINFDWRINSIKSLKNRWPDLEYLHIDRLKGSLKPFSGADLSKLFLVRPSISSFDDIVSYSNIQMLRLSEFRFDDDVSKLSQLNNLSHLCVERRSLLTGWETFQSDSLSFLRATRIPSKSILENFPNLRGFDIEMIDDTKEEFYSNVDLDDDPFSSIVDLHNVPN